MLHEGFQNGFFSLLADNSRRTLGPIARVGQGSLVNDGTLESASSSSSLKRKSHGLLYLDEVSHGTSG